MQAPPTTRRPTWAGLTTAVLAGAVATLIAVAALRLEGRGAIATTDLLRCVLSGGVTCWLTLVLLTNAGGSRLPRPLEIATVVAASLVLAAMMAAADVTGMALGIP